MKKLLGILVLGLLWCNVANVSSWLWTWILAKKTLPSKIKDYNKSS